jgi:hypothetical protein
MSRLSAWLVTGIGVISLALGLFTSLTASASFPKLEQELLEDPLFGDLLSRFWEFEFAGRTLKGEWDRSLPFIVGMAIITTIFGVFCIWIGLASLRSSVTDDWRRR